MFRRPGRAGVNNPAASGRKLPVVSVNFQQSECPLLVKADVQPGAAEIGLPNDRFTPGTGHWAKLTGKVCL